MVNKYGFPRQSCRPPRGIVIPPKSNRAISAFIVLWCLLFAGLCILLGAIFSAKKSEAQVIKPAYSDVEIVEAIFQAEGGNLATYPYGIRSVTCEGLNECRQVCLNTVRNNRKRFANQTKYDNYLEFLASRYCPVGAKNDPKGLNRHWLKNVSYFLRRSS